MPLAMFLVWWGVWGSRGEVISVREVTAVVLSDDGKTCLVQVESGQQVRIIKPRNAAVGMQLRMRRTEYDDGELRFDAVAGGGADMPHKPQAVDD